MRRYSDFQGDGGADVLGQVMAQRRRLAENLASVGALVPVMSGKGGVGKSTVTVGLAAALARKGLAVAIMDADLNGPTIPRLLGLSGARASLTADGIEPPRGPLGIAAMSSEFFLQGDGAPLRFPGFQDEPSTWRPTAEMTTLRELLTHTSWGRLDALLLDLPPGADRLPAIAPLLPRLSGAVVVTLGTPVALEVVRRSVTAARDRWLPIAGLVENMAGQPCAACGASMRLFGEEGAARRAAADMDVPFLGEVPFDRALASAAEQGRPIVGGGAHGPAEAAHDRIAHALVTLLGAERAGAEAP